MLGAKKPFRVPTWLARPMAGEVGIAWLTRLRGADNARARETLGWEPEHRSWRDGLASGDGAHQT
jgi:nucleoside-diphosphate-sugar epimerase